MALAALAGTGHSALVQWSAREGERALDAARAAHDAPTRDERLQTAARQLARASALGLVPSVELENKLGQVLFTLARAAEAEPHLARALELDPTNRSARVFLARCLVARGAHDEAATLLERVFELDPRDPGLPVALGELLRVAPEHEGAASLRARLER